MPIDQNNRIARQIEASADNYPPATYSGNLSSGEANIESYLTYYNDISLTADPLAYQFIPLSAAQNSKNPKMFAIGVIAPTARVSGLLLDRSASVRALEDQTYFPQPSLNGANRADYVKSLITWACGPPKGRDENDPIYQQVVEGRDVGTYQKSYSSCGDLCHWMLYRLGVRSDLVNRDENGGWQQEKNISKLAFSQAASNVTPSTSYKPGDIIIIWNESNGTDAHAIVVTEQNGSSLSTGEYGQPGGAEKTRTITTKDGKPFIGKRQIQKVIPLETVLELARQNGELADITLPGDLANSVGGDSRPGNWTGQQAAEARKLRDKTANSLLTEQDLNVQFTNAQRAQILDLQKSLEAMQNTPPLRMMVNPSTFSVKGERIVADSAWSRNGTSIVEHWGPGQDKISASGKVAGFYAIDVVNATGPGLTRMARNYSQAWQNFQSLYLLYKNNGGIYTKDLSAGGTGNNMTLVGSVYLYYDGIMYVGSFDSLSVGEADTSPHTVDYSFEFTVRAAFLLDNPNPNDTGTYGVAQQSANKPVTSAAFFK